MSETNISRYAIEDIKINCSFELKVIGTEFYFIDKEPKEKPKKWKGVYDSVEEMIKDNPNVID